MFKFALPKINNLIASHWCEIINPISYISTVNSGSKFYSWSSQRKLPAAFSTNYLEQLITITSENEFWPIIANKILTGCPRKVSLWRFGAESRFLYCSMKGKLSPLFAFLHTNRPTDTQCSTQASDLSPFNYFPWSNRAAQTRKPG